MPSDTHALEELKIDKRAKDHGRVPPGVWLLVLLAAVGALVSWWWPWWQPGGGVVEVTVAAVQEDRADAAGGAVLNASGYVTARRRATVSSKVTGRVLEVLVEEGMPVRKGQVLARLDPTTVERYLSLAEAELAATRKAVAENGVRLEQARLTLKRMEQLRTDGIANQADLDAARTEVSALEARLALSNEQVRVSERQVAVRQNDLADTTIVAPFDGVAISKDAQPGEMISPVSAGGGFTRTGICTVVDMSSLEIEVDVNESYIHRVTPAQRVEATLDAYPEWKIPAKVITMVPTADRQKATVLVRIGFEPSASSGAPRAASGGARLDARILPDMGVKVAFLGAEPAAASPGPPAPRLRVPKGAVHAEGGTSIVWVVGAEGRVERRAVRVGATRDDQVTVESGVAAGERVVVTASAPLNASSRILVK
jgi:HlyD family secretion protein